MSAHVVSGLLSKRAEIVGQIDAKRTELEELSCTLSHLDHTIKLFSPETDLRKLKGKRLIRRNALFSKGEAQAMVLDTLREFKVCDTRCISERLIQIKGESVTPELLRLMQRISLSVLKRLEKRNIVTHDNGANSTVWCMV